MSFSQAIITDEGLNFPDNRIDFKNKKDTLVLNRTLYKDKLKGFWLGSCIANWTGLPTENKRTDFPFFTDADFGSGKYNYVLDEDPWGADDDTDIEYVYQHAIEKFDNPLLSGPQISAEWKEHISLPLLWVSNLAALGQMQNGAIPPATSLPENNPMWDMIDAQLTTEIFGALAPGRPDFALQMGHLPVRTTAYLHSEWAAEFYIIMYALAARTNPEQSRKEQTQWMAAQARKRIPEWSYIADMYDFVKQSYENNDDKENWEKTRDEVARRYQHTVTSGYNYKYPWDAGINFAASMVSLFYGEGDYKKTIRIGVMCGWDSDNPAATWGGLLGLLYGHEELENHFGKTNFSEDYNIARTRYKMPIPLDNFTAMADRGLLIIDKIVKEHLEGKISGDNWSIPLGESEIVKAGAQEIFVPWITIEDNDPAWEYNGFKSEYNNWNASGAYLARGYANCSAEITFVGKAVQYYAYRSPKGGNVNIILDGIPMGTYSLEDNSSSHGQYYVKIFEKLNLDPGAHTIKIIGDATEKEKTIDMLSIIP
ncbi:ADP-ribosylglycohydrolase family protein [Muriicola sp. Z0-33]|uniref:ADP-ribosylglycohydrolase family protein n=1 Tax=Muriicola sp. Z0-33 TaxID=2816957 RepID=UPI00223799FD|nr:ADP-ribosylglycohydrolase family protein [Muriicola sp. Z0-33]MCW5517135.1 ADP-ribosylglycohydrolase family protein [Muriicola sp. Z0-33]